MERMILLILFCICACSCTRPMGVRKELATFYNPTTDFNCLDGSATIPFIQVNDNYCDCDDGSDEPGTSACPEGKFYCENKSHKSLVIPSSRVNDGICDCCDGSDEWDSGSPCQDTCSELGRAAREAAALKSKIAMEGFSIKQGMIKEAQLLHEEKIAKVSEHEAKKSELEALKSVRMLEKEDAEKPEKEALDFYRQLEEEENRKKEEEEKAKKEAEAGELFNLIDTNSDGTISLSELQARPGLDTNKDGSVSEEEANFFLSGNEQFDRETFLSVGYALLKPYIDLEESEPSSVVEIPEVEKEMPIEDPNDAAAQDPQVYDPWRANQHKENDEDEEVNDYEDEEEKDEDDYDITDTPEAPVPTVQEAEKYDERTRNLISAADDARKAFEEVDRQLRDIDRDIKKIKDEMEKDFGPENEFLVLSGQCFEFIDNEYVYKLCPFDSCTQRSKNGGSETRLGGWGEWRGPENYSQMKYTGGQQCWNGPARSTLVYLHCATENKLTAVSEPNRCEYEMHFYTPAACSKPTTTHDEL